MSEDALTTLKRPEVQAKIREEAQQRIPRYDQEPTSKQLVLSVPNGKHRRGSDDEDSEAPKRSAPIHLRRSP